MLGFRWMDRKDLTTGLESYTEFQQSWPFVGIASLSETRLAGSGNGGVLKRTVTSTNCQIPQTLAACAVAPLNIYFPYIATAVEYAWDTNGAAFPVVTSASTYAQNPQFGDPTQVVISTNDGSSKTSINTFMPADTNNWIAPRLQQTSVTSVTP